MSFCSPPRMHGRSLPSALRAIPLLGASVFLAAALGLPTPPVRAEVPATADVALPPDHSIAGKRTFPGILLPGRTALLKSKYDGVLAKVLVTVGTQVSKGQLMIQLVADEERVERDRAAVLLKQAQADLERTRHLHSRGGTSDESLEMAETAFSLAQADLDLASIRLEEHSIRAPFDGIVAERYVDPGTSVEAGDPLLRVTALSPLRVEALLPESMLPAFSDTTVVQLSTSYPETTIYVAVCLNAIVVDPASGTFPLQIEIDNSEGRMVPGVSCVVTIPAPARGSP